MSSVSPEAMLSGLFEHLAAHSTAKIALASALIDAGGDRDGAAGRAAEELLQAVNALLAKAQQAGAVRDDMRLDEVCTLLVGAAQAAARGHLDLEARQRMFRVIRDGLSPSRG